MFQINPSELEENVTQDEIISIVNEGQEQGVLEAEEAEMISNIIEFDESVKVLQTEQIMKRQKNLDNVVPTFLGTKIQVIQSNK